jgi:reductive dehalogenase
MIFLSNKNRPFHYGSFPLERLKRNRQTELYERSSPRRRKPAARQIPDTSYARALDKYHAIFGDFREGSSAPARAPVPGDRIQRMIDIKGAGYFLDASQIGICRLSEACWYNEVKPNRHTHAIVVLAEYPRLPEQGSLARGWLESSLHETAEMRAYEIAVGIANHIRMMGFQALAHDEQGDLDWQRLAVLAGLGIRRNITVINPWLHTDYALAVVSTDYDLACDLPLAEQAGNDRGLGWWLGLGGAQSGLERWRRNRRATHLGKYPMEQVNRVARPTTLILDDEVPRVSKRAAFFERAVHGDLDAKAQRERNRFAFKHPFAAAMTQQIRAMVPHQNGSVANARSGECEDAEANTRAIKSLSYALGSEITGICAIPDYAWYSHKADGSEIKPCHTYAVVCLIDQGYDTMEGASGDDFISGAQSMRAYMRGALIAGIMAEHIRAMGYPARSQTNADSDVLHLPLTLWAGLGELSRIGEVVLNPFMGPRLKTVVMTTDLPLIPDKPVHFGLQYFCANCLKCARECPCDAIPQQDKVMFNGYEIWKPDVERCTRYRLTNQRGLACGRCMKTCPLNKFISWDGSIVIQAASWLGINALWLKPLLVPIAVRLDDLLGHGIRNPVKKWWLDLEIVDGVCIKPTHGVNQRDLDIYRKMDPQKHKVAYYHASMMPPPNASGIPVPVVRRDGLAAAALVETPEQAVARREAGGPVPEHYLPTPPIDTSNLEQQDVSAYNPYATGSNR